MNRRANTRGLVVRDNRIFDIRIMQDGYGVGHSAAQWYRRRLTSGRVVTGKADY